MKEKAAYECVLGIIMEEDGLELQEVKVEQVVLNLLGKRAIRLDAWAADRTGRRFNVEMQNRSRDDSMPKRSRFYQGLMDVPLLKAGKSTKYRELPSTVIIFITQEDIFRKDFAKYTFAERCEETDGLCLGDGTKKIFLNMSSRNGSEPLVSLLQYMKDTTLDNPGVTVADERLRKLDGIVREVRESEEWEEIHMNILEQGIEQGLEQGENRKLVAIVCKLLKKGFTASEIAGLLEEDAVFVAVICDAAGRFAPDYDAAETFRTLQGMD